MTKVPTNIGASVRAKLHALSRANQLDLQMLMLRFANERLLHRLARSPHAQSFVLKGATLFTAWLGHPHRATRDIDLLGFGDDDEARVREIFRALVAPPHDDGVEFDTSIVSSPIREDQRYGGVRLTIKATIGGARVSLQVDIGFGDAITPGATVIELPTLLSWPAPRLASYPRETVVAEKLEAMVQLGRANSRMKDFFDLATLAESFSFDGPILVKAIRSTFQRRQTTLPTTLPDGLTDEFSHAPVTQLQWRAFLKKAGLPPTRTFPETVAMVARFAAAPLLAAVTGTAFEHHWRPGGPWS
ncbi:MAG TPA: nucleotidyl transferase AbiEii/AbiGii toxin family protein [Myxococcota bacterium]|nr:nucleotidyl transferase AbiEii/AbiGii toxin family protein [Myxococcota bacterium]